jgi:hypothetical protein
VLCTFIPGCRSTRYPPVSSSSSSSPPSGSTGSLDPPPKPCDFQPTPVHRTIIIAGSGLWM